MIDATPKISGPVVARGIPILTAGVPTAPLALPHFSFKKKNIVLWVPGTNDHLIPEKFRKAVEQMFGPDTEIVLVDYPATQMYLESSRYGMSILRATLDLIQKNSPNAKVYIGALSQGAMVASEVLSDPKYMGIVERAALMGHPGVSHHHYENHRKVREYNNMFDQTTVDWAEDKDKFLQNVEMFLQGDIFAGVRLLGTIITHPVEAIMAGVVNLYRVPILNFPKLFGSDVHDYTERMDDAASWLRHGKIP